MTLVLPPFLQGEPGKTTPKPMLPSIWQTLADSGIEVKVAEFETFCRPCESRREQVRMTSNIVSCPPQRKRKTFKRTIFTEMQKRVLNNWLSSHKENPYPTLTEKQELMTETGLSRDQINVWFTNNRIRHGLTGIHATVDQVA